MKMAIIGYGGMANCHYKDIIKKMNDSGKYEQLDVVGIYDIDEKRNEYAKSLGLYCYKSAEELYEDKSIEMVLVATPNDLHKPYAVELMKHGKNVIVEKPIALSSAEVDEMYAAAKKYGRVFAVHQNRRWDEDFLTIRELCRSGKLGDVYRIESRVMGSHGIPGAWRKVYAQGGGMMLDWGVHLIDQMLLFVDSPVVSITCDYSYIAKEDVDDGFDLLVTFENGVRYRIVVDTNSFINLPRWQVYGLNGTARIDDWKLNGEVVTCVERVDKNLKVVNAGNGFTKTMAERNADTVERTPLDPVYGDRMEFYANFMAAIREGVPTIVQEHQVKRVFKLMELAEKSAKEHITINEKF